MGLLWVAVLATLFAVLFPIIFGLKGRAAKALKLFCTTLFLGLWLAGVILIVFSLGMAYVVCLFTFISALVRCSKPNPDGVMFAQADCSDTMSFNGGWALLVFTPLGLIYVVSHMVLDSFTLVTSGQSTIHMMGSELNQMGSAEKALVGFVYRSTISLLGLALYCALTMSWFASSYYGRIKSTGFLLPFFIVSDAVAFVAWTILLFARVCSYYGRVRSTGLLFPFFVISDTVALAAWTILLFGRVGHVPEHELQAGTSFDFYKEVLGLDVKPYTTRLLEDVFALSLSLWQTSSTFDAIAHVYNFVVKRVREGDADFDKLRSAWVKILPYCDLDTKVMSLHFFSLFGRNPLAGGGVPEYDHDLKVAAMTEGPPSTGGETPGFELQSDGVIFNRIKNIGNYPRISGLIKIASVFVGLITMKSFDMVNVQAVMEASKNSSGVFKDTGDVIKLFLDTLTAVYQCIVGFSIEPFFANDNPIAQWSSDVDLFVAKASKFETLHDSRIMGDDLSSLLNEGDRLKARYGDIELIAKKAMSPQILKAIQIKNTELLFMYSKLVVIGLRNSQRAAPFGICLSGPSSIGKSCLVNTLHAINCAMFSPGCDPDSKLYTYTGATKHMDSLNQDVTTFLMDDIAKENPEKVKECEDLNILIGVGNSVSFTPPMARAEEKGTKILAPKALIVSTNTEHLHARRYMAHPVAVWRRINYVVRMSVVPEYRKANTAQLDERKMPRADDPASDGVWEFKVIQKVFTNDHEVQYAEIPEDTVLTTNSKKEFMIWYRDSIRAHHDRENAKLESTTRVKTCERCCLPLNACVCGVEPQSGPVPDGVWNSLTFLVQFLLCYFICTIGLVTGVYVVFRRRTYEWVMHNPVYRWYVRFDYLRNRLRAWWAIRRFNPARIPHFRRVLFCVGLLLALAGLWRLTKGLTLQGDKELGVNDDVKAHWANNSRVPEDFSVNGAIKTTRHAGLDLSNSVVKFHMQALNTTHERCGDPFSINGFIYRENRVVTVGHEFTRLGAEGACSYRCQYFTSTGETQEFLLPSELIYNAKDRGYDIALFRLPVGHYRKDYLGNESNTYFHRSGHKSFSDVAAFIGRAPNDWVKSEGRVTSFGEFPVKTGMFGVPSGPRMPIFYGTWEQAKGHCGSPIVTSGTGYAYSGYSGILGIHFAAHTTNRLTQNKVAVGIQLSYEIMKEFDRELDQLATSPLGSTAHCEVQSLNLAEGHFTGPIHQRCSSNWVVPNDLNEGTRLKRYCGLWCERGLLSQGKDKTKVAPTGIARRLGTYLADTYRIVSDKLGPDMRSSAVFQNILRSFKPSCAMYKPPVLWLAQLVILRQLYVGLEKSEYYKDGKIAGLGSFTDVEMVNGKGAHVPCVNLSTSAGYPYRCPKRDLVEEVEGGVVGSTQKLYVFNKDVMARYHDLWDRVKSGSRLCTIYTTSLKDEAIRREKVVNKTTRPIFGAPIDRTLLSRKLFGNFLILIRTHRELFRSAVGMNAESLEWDKLARKIAQYHYKIDGDYKNWDRNAFSYHSLSMAYDIAIFLCVRFGKFTHFELAAMEALKEDFLAPFIEFFGTLFMGGGSMPSGDFWTTDMNCLHNWLVTTYAVLQIFYPAGKLAEVYEVCSTAYKAMVSGSATDGRHPCNTYAIPCTDDIVELDDLAQSEVFQLRRFYALNKLVSEHSDKFSVVMPAVDDVYSVFYGDDNVLVSDDERLTFDNVSSTFAKSQVIYTPAEKHLSTYESKNLEDLTFLKRRFIYDAEYKVYKAPLEPEILNKILLVKLYKTQSEMCGDLEAISICWRYACNYTREECARWHGILKDIATRMGYETNIDWSKLPSYDQRMKECYEADSAKPSECCPAAYTLEPYYDTTMDCFIME
ncbi:hypothetical protein 1 [Beihai picorna-like virus 58]|uniref:hypothetical protein 1 n=1 Tax=Beihai picorna-like virus 58 TaxID=1922603 RepID=UPI00090CAA30|nr:hypothetical protein 1 [Beihai picorna-like virus 58]APG76706.1 hypothetical protein 1 [Beihai picorna-like virus 58]